MSGDMTKLRDVLKEYDEGWLNGYGDLTRALDTLVAALRRRDTTIKELRKSASPSASSVSSGDTTP